MWGTSGAGPGGRGTFATQLSGYDDLLMEQTLKMVDLPIRTKWLTLKTSSKGIVIYRVNTSVTAVSRSLSRDPQ